jgi:hypothetical protein
VRFSLFLSSLFLQLTFLWCSCGVESVGYIGAFFVLRVWIFALWFPLGSDFLLYFKRIVLR